MTVQCVCSFKSGQCNLLFIGGCAFLKLRENLSFSDVQVCSNRPSLPKVAKLGSVKCILSSSELTVFQAIVSLLQVTALFIS